MTSRMVPRSTGPVLGYSSGTPPSASSTAASECGRRATEHLTRAPRGRSQPRRAGAATIPSFAARRSTSADVGSVLRPVATKRHRAPCGRAVLRAIVEGVAALAASLEPSPGAVHASLVEDGELEHRSTAPVEVQTQGAPVTRSPGACAGSPPGRFRCSREPRP
jgi:hypothetical protein